MNAYKFGSVLGVTALIMGPSQLAAEGALAVGRTGNVAADGVAIGGSFDKATRAEAIAAALEDCINSPTSRNRWRCKIVSTFTGQCYAVVFDPETGTPGAGWAVAPTLATARKQAMANCQATAEKDRSKFCRITDITACDKHN